MAQIDHKTLLRRLPPDARKHLVAQSNWPGLRHLALHLGAIGIGAIWILNAVPGWQLVLVLQGVFISFLFTALHETIHRTAFRSDWLNTLVSLICGFAIVIAPTWFRYFHFAHHRYTHEPGRDPELETPKPETLKAYLLHVSGLPVWFGNVRVLVGNALRLRRDRYVPDRGQKKVAFEARCFLLAYAGVIVVSVSAENDALLWAWLIPAVLGQPALRLYLLAEHARCPHVSNMLENTRTTFTTWFVRFLAWNMPYHIEHHTYPAVPFHKLPDFHQAIKAHLGCTERGYARFNKRYVAELSNVPHESGGSV